MSTLLGTTSDGRTLTYDASLYEFSLDGELASFGDLQMLDARNWIRWRAEVLRDWFRRIVPTDLEACNRRARAAIANLQFRSSDESVAVVDDSGRVEVRGPGETEIFACRVNAAGAGPEARLVTIAVASRALESGMAAAVEEYEQPTSQLPLEGVSLAASEEGAAYAEEAAPAEGAVCETGASSITKSAPVSETVVGVYADAAPMAQPITSSEMKSFKGKGGKLAKEKSFEISSSLPAPASFEKTDGDEGVLVSPDGTVTVSKGLPKGIYTADVRAVSSSADAPTAEENITVTVKVK